MLVAFRFVCGLAIGGSSVLGPMYIAEIAPAKSRGRLVALFQCNVVFGILVAYFSNFVVGQCSFGALEWRVDLAVPAIPALARPIALDPGRPVRITVLADRSVCVVYVDGQIAMNTRMYNLRNGNWGIRRGGRGEFDKLHMFLRS